MSTDCSAQWADDYGKDHECYEDPDHDGGHQCGCGARVPAHLLDALTVLAAEQDRIAAALALLEPIAADRSQSTHWDGCHNMHTGCLAALTITTLTGEDT